MPGCCISGGDTVDVGAGGQGLAGSSWHCWRAAQRAELRPALAHESGDDVSG